MWRCCSCRSRCIRSVSKVASIANGSTAWSNSRANRHVDAGTAKVHAPRQARRQVRFIASIEGSALLVAGLSDTQSPTTPSAGQETRQRRPAASDRFVAAGAAIIVERQMLLIALVLLPAKVAFLMVPDHRLPGYCLLAMPVACGALSRPQWSSASRTFHSRKRRHRSDFRTAITLR
jgi:hypothetical protein